MRTKTLISVFSVLCLFGCKSPTDSVQSPQLFSLQKAWIYSDQTFDPIDSVKMSVIDSVYIVSSMINNSKTNYSLSDRTVLIVDSNRYMTGVIQTDCMCDVEKIPAISGDTVMRHDGIPLKVGGKVVSGSLVLFVRNVDTTITVPAGTFQCAVYQLESFVQNAPTGISTICFISPSVGLVQYDDYLIDESTNKIYLARSKQLIRTVK